MNAETSLPVEQLAEQAPPKNFPTRQQPPKKVPAPPPPQGPPKKRQK